MYRSTLAWIVRSARQDLIGNRVKNTAHPQPQWRMEQGATTTTESR